MLDIKKNYHVLTLFMASQVLDKDMKVALERAPDNDNDSGDRRAKVRFDLTLTMPLSCSKQSRVFTHWVYIMFSCFLFLSLDMP